MKKLFRKVCVVVLAGVMLASAVGCGKNESSNTDVNQEQASNSEAFAGTTLDVNQVQVLGEVYELPFAYSKVTKKLTLREEMTEKFNVKIPARGSMNSIFLDVVGENGSYVEVTLRNSRGQEEMPKTCDIAGMKLTAGKINSQDVVLPSGVGLGTTAYDITGYYGEPTTTIDEQGGFTYIYENATVKYTFVFKKDAEGCQEIVIECK